MCTTKPLDAVLCERWTSRTGSPVAAASSYSEQRPTYMTPGAAKSSGRRVSEPGGASLTQRGVIRRGPSPDGARRTGGCRPLGGETDAPPSGNRAGGVSRGLSPCITAAQPAKQSRTTRVTLMLRPVATPIGNPGTAHA
jgi:hypothetical protein